MSRSMFSARIWIGRAKWWLRNALPFAASHGARWAARHASRCSTAPRLIQGYEVKIQIGIVIALLFSFGQARAQEKPPLPFTDTGSCPFECCTYGDWHTTKPVDVHRSASIDSPISFRIAQGQLIHAVTGVVVTTQYGITKILKPLRIGYTRDGKSPELSSEAGDVLYTLHYSGEASDLFWYHGKTYTDQIDVPAGAFGSPPNASVVQVVSRPKYEWWVKVRDAKKGIGWTKETKSFSGADACE